MKIVIVLMPLLLLNVISYCSQKSILTVDQLRASAHELRQLLGSNGQSVSATAIVKEEDEYLSESEELPVLGKRRNHALKAARHKKSADAALSPALKRLAITSPDQLLTSLFSPDHETTAASAATYDE